MEKCYCVNLTGMGDVECFLVDKEVYDWIVCGQMTGRGQESEWEDQDCPESVQKRIGRTVFVTIGSLDNDRALQAQEARLLVDGKESPCFLSEGEALVYVGEKGLSVEDTYHGCLY